MGKGLWLKILPLWSTFCKLRSLETGEHLYFACEIPSSLCWSFCCCVPVLPFHPVHLSNCDKAEGNELDQNEQVCTGSCSVHINLLTQVDSLTYVACYCAFQSPPLTEYHCSLGNLVYAIESKSGIAKHPLS